MSENARDTEEIRSALYQLFVRLGESVGQQANPKVREFVSLIARIVDETEREFEGIDKVHLALKELNRRGARRREPPRI